MCSVPISIDATGNVEQVGVCLDDLDHMRAGFTDCGSFACAYKYLPACLPKLCTINTVNHPTLHRVQIYQQSVIDPK